MDGRPDGQCDADRRREDDRCGEEDHATTKPVPAADRPANPARWLDRGKRDEGGRVGAKGERLCPTRCACPEMFVESSRIGVAEREVDRGRGKVDGSAGGE